MLKAHVGVLTGCSGALGALFSECCTSGAISLGHTLETYFYSRQEKSPRIVFD